VAPGWLNPYIVGHYQLEVTNDIFNGVGTLGLVTPPRHTRSAAWHRTVRLPCTVVVPGEWLIVLELHCRCIVATCPHVLQGLTAVPARVSCKPMMALTSNALETCARALGSSEPCCTCKSARLFFMLEARCPHRIVGHMTA
jgi:hypothetical protein